jgi:hypothetical protein
MATKNIGRKSKAWHRYHRVLEDWRKIKNSVGHDAYIYCTQHPGTKKVVCSISVLHESTPESVKSSRSTDLRTQSSTPNAQHPTPNTQSIAIHRSNTSSKGSFYCRCTVCRVPGRHEFGCGVFVVVVACTRTDVSTAASSRSAASSGSVASCRRDRSLAAACLPSPAPARRSC